MMRFIISLAIAIIPHLAFAQTNYRLDILPYGAYLNYSNTSAREYSLVTGMYSYLGLGLRNSIEGDFSYTRVNYGTVTDTLGNGRRNSRSVNINQVDATLVYSNYTVNNLRLQGGAHIIFSEDDLTDRGTILFGGIQRFQPYRYNAGVDVYATFYNNYLPELRVLQTSGTFGFYFGNDVTYGRFYSETRGHYILLSEEIDSGGKEFASIEQSLNFTHNKLTLQGFFWTGFQMFGVQKNGFVVYNLNDRHLGAYGGSVKLLTTKSSSLKLVASRARFRETGVVPVATSLSATLILGFTL